MSWHKVVRPQGHYVFESVFKCRLKTHLFNTAYS